MTPVTALDRIRQHVAATRRRGPLRILLTAGNPLGDAVGDTVMATRHIAFLAQFDADVRVQVWTGTPDIWRALCPGVEPVAMPSEGDLARACDVAVFECARVSPALVESLVRAGNVVLAWHAWDERIGIRFGASATLEVRVPPLVNRTTRVDEVYRALGCRPVASVLAGSTLVERRPMPDIAPGIVPPAARVFFNPYASSGAKSLSSPLCEALLAGLRRTLPPSVTLAVPAVPHGRTSDDADRYAELGKLVSTAARRWPAIERLPRLSTVDYLEHIARASLVIGPDTSSQHVAVAFGRASIACYPPYVGLPFYLYWGPVAPTALHFLVPDDRQVGKRRGLVRLVAETARALLDGSGRAADGARSTRGPGPASSRIASARAARRFLEQSRRYLTGELQTRRPLLAALRMLDDELPESWKAHLLPELVEVYETLPSVRQRPWRGDRRTALVRLDHLNAPKTLGVLGMSAGARLGLLAACTVCLCRNVVVIGAAF